MKNFFNEDCISTQRFKYFHCNQEYLIKNVYSSNTIKKSKYRWQIIILIFTKQKEQCYNKDNKKQSKS